MFTVQGVDKYYGARAILDQVALTIGKGERVGLIGRNGCGKSTLLRILAAADTSDGKARTAAGRGLSFGYLPQIADFPAGIEVLEASMQGASPGVQQWQARKALIGLGFHEAQLQQTAASLSGGEKTRLMLARLLLGEHDLLLLDEPTSDLDISALQWLEQFLQNYKGAYLIASHDRRFLDRSVTRILELEDARITEYPGNYSAYAELKRQALAKRKEDYILQQRQIRALQ